MSSNVLEYNVKPKSTPINSSKVSRITGSSRNLAVEKINTAPSLGHSEWAEKAWLALTRSLDRSPLAYELSEVDHRAFVERYANRSRDGTAIPWLKFHLSYIFAYAAGQTELPTPPGQGEPGEIVKSPDGSMRVGILGGELGRVIRGLMARGRSGNFRCIRSCYDIMMSKIGMPPAPASFVIDAFRSHVKALTKVGDPYRPMYDQFVLGRVREKIDEIVSKVFKGQSLSHRDLIPSLRACRESGLGDQGALGDLFRSFWLRGDEVDDNNPFGRYPEVDSDPDLPPISSGRQSFYTGSVHDRISPDTLLSMQELPGGKIEAIYWQDHSDLVLDFQNFVDREWQSRLNDPIRAVPVPILEPLKVRMITKGQSAEYYRCLELQKMMHGALRRHPVFEYIGHPIDEESWARCFKTLSDLQPDEFFVSGDYKGATDNLDSSLSEYTWLKICQYVTLQGERLVKTPYYRLGLKALTGHQLEYPATYQDQPTDLPSSVSQSWGQLMGSPMSFPILCIVNAAATLTALDRGFHKDLSLKVNGDDVAFICNDDQYQVWKEVTKICGLEFSLGKNYTSRKFIVMNSELRRVPLSGTSLGIRQGKVLSLASAFPDESFFFYEDQGDDLPPKVIDYSDSQVQLITTYTFPHRWKLEGFLNQSLLYRSVKKGMDAGQIKDVYWTDLQSISHELLRGIPNRDQGCLMRKFLGEYSDVVRELPPYCNKWLPCSLGGAGLCLPKGWSLDSVLKEYDDQRLEGQLKQAAFLSCNPKARQRRVVRSQPIVGEIGEVFRSILSASDQVRKPTLMEKPLNRNQKVLLGGSLFLGTLMAWSFDLFQASSSTDSRRRVGGCLRSEAAGGAHSEMTHAKEARHLNNRYQNWLRSAGRSSLQPMLPEHAYGYQEHLTMVSWIEAVSVRTAGRFVDYGHFALP